MLDHQFPSVQGLDTPVPYALSSFDTPIPFAIVDEKLDNATSDRSSPA